MDKMWYYFVLAIVTTYCVIVTEHEFSKAMFTISTFCWWTLFISNFIARIA